MSRLGLLLVGSLCLAPVFAVANAPAPPRPKASVIGKAALPVEIVKAKLDDGVKARLVIPKGLKVEGLRIENNPGPNLRSEIGSLRTIAGGAALSLAAVGLVFAFRGSRKTKVVAGSLILAAGLIGTWSAAQADLAIPGVGRSRPPRPEPAAKATILIEVQEAEGEHATLFLAE